MTQRWRRDPDLLLFTGAAYLSFEKGNLFLTTECEEYSLMYNLSWLKGTFDLGYSEQFEHVSQLLADLYDPQFPSAS